MANGKRHIGLFGVAGVLVATLIIAGFMFVGNVMQVFGNGVLTIRIMDKPVELKELWLTVDYASIQSDEESWMKLDLTSNEPFDLLKLQDVSAILSVTELPAGSYKMIKIHVSHAEAVYANLPEGVTNPVQLKVPSDVIKVILKPALTLRSGEEATVVIDLQPVGIGEIAISNSLNLRPVVKAVISGSSETQ